MRLIIKKFSCIESADIHFKDYTVFIGEQASGKSITCKLYFFLRDTVSRRIVLSLAEDESWEFFAAKMQGEFYSIFPEYSWHGSDFSVRLLDEAGDAIISIAHKAKTLFISLEFSEEIKSIYYAAQAKYRQTILESQGRQVQLFLSSMAFSAFDSECKNRQRQYLNESITYIPSGRSFFSTLQNNVFGLLSENIPFDPFLKLFGGWYEKSKNVNVSMNAIRRAMLASENKEPANFDKIADFDRLSGIILKGHYQSKNNEDWLVAPDEREVKVFNASSGQQESLPVILVLRALQLNPSGFSTGAILVEEPEAHLFPSSQKAMIELLFLASTMGAKPKLILTTHSPYVLTCANNELLKINGEPGAKISAYYLAGGKAYDIVDKTSGLIDGTELDKISTEIAEEFYAALESAQ